MKIVESEYVYFTAVEYTLSSEGYIPFDERIHLLELPLTDVLDDEYRYIDDVYGYRNDGRIDHIQFNYRQKQWQFKSVFLPVA